MNRVVISLIFSLMLSGCFPFPWKKQFFEPVHPSLGSWHTPEQTEELRPYFVANRYFHMIVPAENGTTTSGGSPFFIIGSIGNKENTIESAKVTDIAIKINGEHYSEYQILKCAGLIDRIDKNEIIVPPFILKASEYWNGGVSFCISPIHVEFAKVESLEVTTEISVSASSRTEARTVTHKFKPKVKSGLFVGPQV